MPYCRSLGRGLWEVRSDLTDGKIGQVIFCVVRRRMVLLHGFMKKTQKTPPKDMETGSETHEGSGVKHGSEEERKNRFVF
jgi:phage-related protein